MSSLDWHAWTNQFLDDPGRHVADVVTHEGGRDALLEFLEAQLATRPEIVDLVPARNVVIVSLQWPDAAATWILSFDRDGDLVALAEMS